MQKKDGVDKNDVEYFFYEKEHWKTNCHKYVDLLKEKK